MPYSPPSGWLERLDDPADDLTRIRTRFHRRRDCQLVQGRHALVPAHRPGSAARCPACAPG